jgi:serine/threonine-protein kinase RsbW
VRRISRWRLEEERVSEVEADGRLHPSGVRDVDVRVNADAEQVSLLRAFAASIAIRLDLDVDAIEDLRMAVDEACSLLVRAARPGGQLRLAFAPRADEIRVHAEVEAFAAAPPSADALSWHILTSLAHSVTEDVAEGPDGHRVCIDLVTRAAGPNGR